MSIRRTNRKPNQAFTAVPVKRGTYSSYDIPVRHNPSAPWLYRLIAVGFLCLLITSGMGVGAAAVGPVGTPIEAIQIPFIENQGQLNSEVSYYARTFAGTVFVTTQGELVYALPQPGSGRQQKSVVVRETLVGANKTSPQGENRSPTMVNVYRGPEKNWREYVATYETVSLGDVYQGVELKLRAHGSNLEKLFYVAPDGKVSDIRLELQGTRELQVQPEGQLVVATDTGRLMFTAPVAYQEIDGARKTVDIAYRVTGDQYGFQVGDYDKSRTLVIDPLLAATYLGGIDTDHGYAMAVLDERVIVAGRTESLDFPISSGTVNADGDVMVAMLSGDLKTLTAVTVFGGSTGADAATDMLLSGSNVYLLGQVNSGDFPLVGGGFSASGPTFVAKLNTDLLLQVTTRFPANNLYGLAVDAGNNVFIAGATITTIPATDAGTPNDPNDDGYQTGINGTTDGFVSKLSADLDRVLVSTYLGGDEQSTADIIQAIAIDAAGNVCVAGTTTAADFPVTPGAYDSSYAHTPGDPFYFTDIFVACLTNNLHQLNAATYLGGVNSDNVNGGFSGGHNLVVGAAAVFVAGDTVSSDFPADTTIGPVAGADAFVAKFDTGLGNLEELVRFGGEGYDAVTALWLDGNDLYAGGTTQSDDFPTTLDAYKKSPVPNYNGGFINRFGSALLTRSASTLLAGLHETIHGIGIDVNGRVVIAGYLFLDGFPVTPGAYQANLAGDNDLYIAKIPADLSAYSPFSAFPTELDFGDVIIGRSASDTVSLTNGGDTDIDITSIGFIAGSSPEFSQQNDCGSTVPAAQQCTITVSFSPLQAVTSLATLRVTSSDSVNPTIDIPITGSGVVIPEAIVSPASLDFGDVEIWLGSSEKTVTIKNTGVSPLNITQISVTGADASVFKIDTLYDHCSGAALIPGAQCELITAFEPTSVGNKAASLVIASNDPINPSLTVPMSGNGVVIPKILVRSEMTFEADINSSIQKIIEVENMGTADLHIHSVSLSSTTDFKIDYDGCSNEVLPPDDWDPSSPGTIPLRCEVHVIFSPTSRGEKTAVVSIASNDPDTPVATVKLIGNPPLTFEEVKSGLCFIATAAYGSYLHEDVVVLRDFRDDYLLTHEYGRALVDIYYRHSPPVADYIAEREWLRTATRWMLTPVVVAIKHPGATLVLTLAAFVFLGLLRYRKRITGGGSLRPL